MHGLSNCVEKKNIDPSGSKARVIIVRGRVRAFGKCTDGGASSKGRQNLESMQLTL